MLVRIWRKKNLNEPLVEMEICTAMMENSTQIPQKLKIEIPYDPGVSLLGVYQI